MRGKGDGMIDELRCPECGSLCEDVKTKKDGSRSGICRNPACRLNQDGIGLVSEIGGAAAAISFPVRGPRLQELLDIVEGKPSREPLPEDVGMLDGLAFCGECAAPIFYDGKGYYRHVQDLPQSRLRKLMRVRRFAEQVYGWLTTLDFGCPVCGKRPNPFVWEISKEEFGDYVATRAGARDLWLLLQGGTDEDGKP
jgi:hypothetical protein